MATDDCLNILLVFGLFTVLGRLIVKRKGDNDISVAILEAHGVIDDAVGVVGY
jgi:hypothetical protein